MKIRNFIAGLMLSAFAVPVLGYESGAWTTVGQIYSKNNGQVFVYFGANAMPGCYQNKAAYLKGSDIDKLYSTVLAAFMAGKSVRPLYHIDTTKTGWGLCYVDAVYLKN